MLPSQISPNRIQDGLCFFLQFNKMTVLDLVKYISSLLMLYNKHLWFGQI